MLPIVITVVILIVVLFLVRFFSRYTVIRVSGPSMLPTLKHGQFLIFDRHFHFRDYIMPDEFQDDIFILQPPNHRVSIKRLISISYTLSETYYWFEGDNKDDSIDSRTYGFLMAENVLGRVVPLKEAFNRTIRR